MPKIAISPLTEAVRKLNAKTPVGSVLRSREWAEVPLALRERAQFSAGVTSARLLQSIQDRMAGLIALQREQLENGKTATFGRSDFIDAIRGIAREEGLSDFLDPAKVGTIQDITSVSRLGLIFDMQQSQAHGFAKWKADQQSGALLLWPAWEFKRIQTRRVPRQDWPERWQHAGGEFFDGGRMIALKTDPVWRRLSRFETPWPPFDYNSGMGLDEVDRDEAVELGLIAEGEIPDTGEEDFNDTLKASVRNLSQEMQEALKGAFGDQIKIEDGAAWWKGDRDGKQLAGLSKPKRKLGQWPTTLNEVQELLNLGGSTGAKLVRDKITGAQYVQKQGNNDDHLREEVVADDLYQAAGVHVPRHTLFESGQRPTKLAQHIEGRTLKDFLSTASAEERQKVLAALQDDFVADALFGNWDVIGLSQDNILVDDMLTPWRIDNGGSLRFRAQGARKKGNDWGDLVTELDTMRDQRVNPQTAQVFGGISDEQIAAQIDRLTSRREEILKAAPEDLRGTLSKRLDYLAQRAAGLRGPFTQGTAEQVRKSRIVGKSLSMDKGDIEDNEALFWEETDADGQTVLKAALKVTPAASDRVMKLMPSQLASGRELFDEDQVVSVMTKAAKTVNHHQKDGQYNQASLNALDQAEQIITDAITSKAINAKDADPYLAQIREIRQAKDAKGKAPMIKRLGIQVVVPKSPGNIQAEKVRQTFESKRVDKGRAKADKQVVHDAGEAYAIQMAGAHVRFRPFTKADHKSYTLQGRIDVTVLGGASPENLKKVAQALSDLTIDNQPTSPEWREALYLFKGINLRQSSLTSTYALQQAKEILADAALTDADRVAKLRQLAQDNGLKIATGKAFNPDGKENGFGEGRRTWDRWDLPREKVEKDMKDYILTHSSSTKTPELLEYWLNQGGTATPTAERLRLGVSISSGMSPSTDLNNGTSDYLFTRIKKRGNEGGQWRFKIGNLARLDALSYRGDWLGGAHKIDSVGARTGNGTTPKEWKQFARAGSNETLFKNGINLLDELEEIRAGSAAEREKILAVFKKHKITHLNDGRKVEDIVKL
ncbi:MAG: hypothetical protein VW338_14885 [Rhodospirillaceae bacterium]